MDFLVKPNQKFHPKYVLTNPDDLAKVCTGTYRLSPENVLATTGGTMYMRVGNKYLNAMKIDYWTKLIAGPNYGKYVATLSPLPAAQHALALAQPVQNPWYRRCYKVI